MQLDSIAIDGRQIVLKSRLDRNAVLRRFTPGQGNDLKDSLVDVQIAFLRSLLSAQRTDPLDDIAGTIAVPDDASERLLMLGGVAFSRREAT